MPPAPLFAPLLAALAAFLVACRLWTVTEAALLGDTAAAGLPDLWLALLSLAAVPLWAWDRWRERDFAIRVGWCDAAVWAVVAAHAVAAVPVLLEGGDRRAAADVVFLWAGLAATFFLVRQVWRSGDGSRWAAVVVAVGVSLAAVGLWQRFVFYPETAATLDRLEAREAAALDDDRPTELAAARAELRSLGVPDDPRSRRQFTDRVRYGREAFGPFALANTLGGVLAFAAVLCPCNGGFQPPRVRSTGFQPVRVELEARPPAAAAGSRHFGTATAALALAALLAGVAATDSKTAFVGLAAGGAAAGFFALRTTRAKATLAALVVGAVLFGGTAWAAGWVPASVRDGVERSLAVRLDYWRGTAKILAERPVLGTGPANFRGSYLRHRPPTATEAVAGPHNGPLELWTSGGIAALLAAGWFAVATIVAAFSRRAPAGSRYSGGDVAAGSRHSGYAAGTLAAFAAAGFAGVVTGTGVDLRPLLTAPLAVLVLWGLTRPAAGFRLTPAAWGAAAVALGVHLLGADGAEYPAVIVLFLLAAANAAPGVTRVSVRALAAAAAVGLGLTIAGAACVLRPVLAADALRAEAEALAAAGRDPDRTFRRAADADPLSDAAALRRAEYWTAAALSSRPPTGAARRAVSLWTDLAAARPHDPHPPARAAAVLMSEKKYADALPFAEEAAARDPYGPERLIALADAAASADDRPLAADAARRALAVHAAQRDPSRNFAPLTEEEVRRMRGLAR